MDQVETLTMGDRIAVFTMGTVEQLGATLEMYKRTANKFVSNFFGSPRINLVKRPEPAGAAAWYWRNKYLVKRDHE